MRGQYMYHMLYTLRERESYPFYLDGHQLTLGAHTQEGYGSCLVCVCVCVRMCVCLSVCTSNPIDSHI